MTDARILVFSIRGYEYLRDLITADARFEQGAVEVRAFPDGERYQRILEEVKHRDVALIGGTISDSATLELYDLACAIVKYGARSLSLVVPYFGYSTMERAVKPGEVVTAKTRARLFSSIPECYVGNRILLLDLHAEGIPHYFEAHLRSIHLYAKQVVETAAFELAGDGFVLACTDAGRAKWVESLANDWGVDAAFIMKRRIDARRTEVAGVSASVAGRNVVIYDDMIRTGSSILGAARAYLDAGAQRVWAITTHGLFPEDALDRLQNSGLLASIVATNSHPRAVELENGFLQVRSVAPLLAKGLLEHP